jgi:hypothetical protein
MFGFIADGTSDMTWRCKYKLFHRKKSPLAQPVDLEKEYKEEVPEEISSKDPTFGADIVIQTLYEGKRANGQDFDWSNFPPKPISKSAIKARDRVALKVYKIKDRDKDLVSGRYPLKYHRIDIQNPLLVNALEPILKKENVHLNVHEIATFKEPFRPLWFCQNAIIDLYQETSRDDLLKGYMQLLLRILDECFHDLKIKLHRFLDKDLIDYRTAWTLFPRNSTIYSYGTNSEFIAKVDDTIYECKDGVKRLLITAKAMSFNGKEFVWLKKTLPIDCFAGNKPIRDLRHYPFDLHPDKESIQESLVARGRKVLDLQGVEYCSYSGIALHAEGEGIERHNVEGRILVDVVGYNTYHLAKGKRENEDPEIEAVDVGQRFSSQDGDNAQLEGKLPGVHQKRLSEEFQKMNKESLLKDPNELAFMTGLIGGYALENKIWGKTITALFKFASVLTNNV